MDKKTMAHIVGQIFGHAQCPDDWDSDEDYLVKSLRAIPDDGYNYVFINCLGGIFTSLGSRGLEIIRNNNPTTLVYEFSLPEVRGNCGPEWTEYLKSLLREWGKENPVYLDLLHYMEENDGQIWMYS